MNGSQDVASLLARCLRAVGATRAFAAPGAAVELPGIDVVAVGDASLASLLADADGRLSAAPSARPGVALLPDGRVRLSSQPGLQVLAQPVLDAGELPVAVAAWSAGQFHTAGELDLDVELSAPAPTGAEPLTLGAADDRLTTLSPSLASTSIALLVGPGVVRSGATAGVVEAAARTGATVVATPGAVGVLPLDHPRWAGVVGLQRDDVALSGLADAELVLASGLDPAESVGVVPDTAQVLEVEPGHLELMAVRWTEPSAATPRPGPLVGALAELSARGRARTGLPLHPARALADLGEVLGPEAVVAVDAGAAGLWAGRGLLARPAGSVVVPAFPARGFAAAAALVAGIDGRAAVAVTDRGDDSVTEAVLGLAAGLGVSLTVEVWGDDVGWTDARDHRTHLVGARHEGGVQRVPVPVDLAATAELEQLGGPVVAWTADPTALA